MKTSQMQSLVSSVKNAVTDSNPIQEGKKVYKGLSKFMDDESMLDDLEWDLQSAGLDVDKGDYELDLDKGTLTIMKTTPGIKSVLRQYRLK